MKRRTNFGSDMGISGWTPIDDDQEMPLAIRPVAEKNLILPEDTGNSYADVGNGMYVPVRLNVAPTDRGQHSSEYSKPESADDVIANERWQQFLAQQRASLPPDDIAYTVMNIEPERNGYIENATGWGGDLVAGNKKLHNGSARALHAGAVANGHNHELRDEDGNLTYGNWGGDAKLHAGMAEFQGTIADGEYGRVGGTFNGPNARLNAGGNVQYIRNPDGTISINTNLSGEAGAYVYDGSVDGNVNIPLTWLNNRWRALKKYFDEDKGERREMDLILGGRASLGVGAGARAGAIVGDQGNGINGFRFYAGAGVGLVPGADVRIGIRDKTGMHNAEVPVRTPESKYFAPYNKETVVQSNRVNFPKGRR